MSMVLVLIAVATAGLCVLAVCGVRLFFAVRDLGRELERARRRLEPKRSALRRELRTLQSSQE